MAIVETIIAKNGATVHISDAAYAGVSKEELDRRREYMEKVAREIAIKNHIRETLAKKEARSEK